MEVNKKIQAQIKKAKAALSKAKSKAAEAERKVEAYTRKNPKKALGYAIAAGVALGAVAAALVRRRKK